MGNRKDKALGLRFLTSIGAFLMIGSVIYILVAGFNAYVGIALASAVLSLGVPAVSAGEGALEMIVGFFESFLDGVLEVVSGIFDAITSIFN